MKQNNKTMEHQKILNLFNESINSKFVIRTCNIINDQANANYSEGNKVKYSTEVLKSNLCDYNDVYVLVKGDINITGGNLATEIAFKNCAPFIKCITKINGTTVDYAEDLDLVMSMYNLLEYSSNYSYMTDSLWVYFKDEAANWNADIANKCF